MAPSDFRLYERVVGGGAEPRIGDDIDVDPPADGIEAVRAVGYDDLPSGAKSELEYVVEDVIESDEKHFVDIYNEAQPITLRLHQLNLLPGIGKKLRNSILDERKRRPFESFEDLEERVPGLHNPQQILLDRILEELRDRDLKYRLFVRTAPVEE
jgi:putative nucleotide binding protein